MNIHNDLMIVNIPIYINIKYDKLNWVAPSAPYTIYLVIFEKVLINFMYFRFIDLTLALRFLM